ncbi:hypothetical protein [Haloarchaeobius amylolyticus]|uniref:hypothetical protein n=1 Tax=Haloarchaeobius amylolyticus TaxID=1198296 RepID=UPI0022702AD2|nr:hypothetical protein [Haloarchaeobius amylolyticus]
MQGGETRALGESWVWDRLHHPESLDELQNLHRQVSLTRRLGGGIRSTIVITAAVGLFFMLGWVLSRLYGLQGVFLSSAYVYTFHLDLLLACLTVLYLDRTGVAVIAKMRESFVMTDVEYYHLLGGMVERLYEPLPYAARPADRRIHLPVAFFFLLGSITLVLLPAVLFSAQLSDFLGFSWSALPLAMRLYLAGTLLIAVLVGVLVAWIVVVGSIYFLVKIRGVHIRLDITRAHDNLGLAPYADIVLKALILYLLVYSITAVFMFRRPTPLYLGIGFLFSLLPVIGLVGSQYGLHRAMVASKQRRLEQLRKEYRDDLDLWFDSAGPEPTEQEPSSDIREFIAAKQAIEDLPEWPIKTDTVARLTSAAIASNAWILLQVAGIIN